MKHTFISFIICLALMLSAQLSQAQTPFAENLNLKLRIAPSEIYDLMIAAPNGYLYIGTDEGLYRYDGQSVRKWEVPSRYAQSLSSLCQTSDGTIWCRNFSGNVFALRADSLQMLPTPTHFGRLINMNTAGQQLFICYEKAILAYTHQTADTLLKLPTNEVFTTFDTENNTQRIAALTATGKLFFTENKHIKEVQTQWKNTDLLLTWWRGKPVATYKNSYHSAPLLELLTGQTQGQIRPNIRVFHSVKEAQNLWFCTADGAICLPNQNLSATQLLAGERVSDIVSNESGTRWLSTLDGKLFQVQSLSISQSFADKRFCSVLLDKNQLILGDLDGRLHRTDTAAATLSSSRQTAKREIAFIQPMTGDRLLTSEGIWQAKTLQLQKLALMGRMATRTRGGDWLMALFTESCVVGANIFDTPQEPEKAALRVAMGTRKILPLRNGRAISCQSLAGKWAYAVGYDDGLWFFDRSGNGHELRTPDGQSITARCMAVCGSQLWVGSTKGLFQLEILENNWPKFIQQFSENEYIMALAADAEGVFYINKKQQVIALNPHTAAKQCVFGVEDILALKIKNLALSPQFIWVVGTRGLFRIRRRQVVQTSSARLLVSLPHSSQITEGAAIDFNYEQIALSEAQIGAISVRTDEQPQWQNLAKSGGKWQMVAQTAGQHWAEFRLSSPFYTTQTQRLTWTVSAKPFTISLEIVLWIIAAVVAVLVLIYFRIKRIKQQQANELALIESQLTAVSAQMNPHFIFNILQSIQGMIMDGDKRTAVQLLGEYAKFTRKILDFSDKKWISIKDEIAHLETYIKLENSRLDNSIRWEIRTDSRLNLQKNIPTQLIHPLIENAIKHGLAQQAGERRLLIDFVLDTADNSLQIEVTDSGIGREAAAQKRKSGHVSFSTNALSKRINLYNLLLQTNITFGYTDLLANGLPLGTKAFIHIKYTSYAKNITD